MNFPLSYELETLAVPREAGAKDGLLSYALLFKLCVKPSGVI